MSIEHAPNRQTPTFLSTRETAKLLGLSPRTLERFRLEGRGPVHLAFGSRRMYALADIVEWAESRRRISTSDMGQ